LKAIIYTQYGSPEVLHLAEVKKPSPKEDEVLVKVYACSINDWDYGKLDGKSLFNRMLSGLFKPKHQILGSDIAGRIVETGKNVKNFKVGDEVYGDLSGKWGGFAEYVCAAEKSLAIKPATMSFIDAAAIPQAAMLAVQGLIDKGKIHRGHKILINGAGGGVGSFGIQLAKLHEAEVTAVDSDEKLEMLRSLGADNVIDYKINDFTSNNQQYDLILDVKTNRSILNYLRALKPNGNYITVGGSMGRLLQALFLKPWIALFTKKRFSIVVLKTNKDLGYMNELFESGKIKTVIDGPYKLADIPMAFTRFGKAEHKGKMVIQIAED
jgi:NADPH:quinone reductase-like Zn-dependent oxidoreductase